jgi:hypothetical protein
MFVLAQSLYGADTHIDDESGPRYSHGLQGPSKRAVNQIWLGLLLALPLVFVLAAPAGATKAAAHPSSPAPRTRTLACDEDIGAGSEANPTGTSQIGPVGLIGVVPSRPLSLQRLSDGVLWFKTYIVVPDTKQHRVTMSVRSLSGGKVGLAWGNQQTDTAKHPRYTALSSLRTSTIVMPLCNGTSAGFPGGFVMTMPLCARLTITAGSKENSDLLPFGGAVCPASSTDLPVKITSVTSTLEPYNPQLANKGIPAEQVNFTVDSVTGTFSCTVNIIRSDRTVGSTTVDAGAPSRESSSAKESVAVEHIKGGTFAGTTSNARVTCRS